MSGDDQEHIDAYHELEQFLADLQAGKAPHIARQLTPDQARIYRMALLFHAATPDVSERSPAFAARLQVRLEDELFARQQKHRSLLRHSLQTASKKQHISQRKLLKDRQLVQSRREGTTIYYSLADHHLRPLFREAEFHAGHVFQENHPDPS